MGRVWNQVGQGLVMVRLFVARQKETRQGKTTRKGDRGSLQQRGQNQDAYREDKWQELSSSVWFGDPGQLIYSSPCPSCSLGLILGWQRQLAILSVCRRGCDSNKKQLLTLQSLHLPTEKPFSVRETPTKVSKSQRPNPVSQSYRCPMWGMLPSLYPGA